MSDVSEEGRGGDPMPGRLIVVAGAPGVEAGLVEAVARAVAADRLRGVAVDEGAVARFVVAGGQPGTGTDPAAPTSPDRDALAATLLRYVAMLAVADVYQRAGYDVALAAVTDTDRLEDLLDLAGPDDATVLRLQPGVETLAGPGASVDASGEETHVIGAALAALNGL